MRSFCTRFILLLAFFSAITVSSRANDSDIVNCNKNWRIVVLGSSTPFGTGASTYDSSWVGKFTSYVKRRNDANEIVNLSIPGFTTYQNLRPDGYTPPPGRPSPTAGFNITAALALDPDAIIINMPSNDAFNNYTISEQQDNFEATMALADAANVPVWVTTSQPRNNITLAQTQNLIQLRDWVQTRFGDKAVDFWSTIANPDGTIVSLYGFDNVHVNNAGHNLFFTRVAAETILDSLCNRFTGTLVARAGNDQSIVLPTNSVTLDGSLSSSSGIINSYSWSKISGPATFTIGSPNTASTSVTNLVEGRYSFALTVTDNNSLTRSDTVNVIVSSRILFDIGPTTTVSPDAGGKYWNNFSDGLPGVKVANAVTTFNTASGISLEVINRIDGTFNPGGPGTNTGNTAGDVGDYGSDATTDFVFAHPSTTSGQWKIGGLNAAKQYTIKFWGTRTVPDDRIIQIKRADQSVWLEYDAKNNTDFNSGVVFTFSGFTEMSFDIRVKDGSAFGHICVVDIYRTSVPAQGNIAPIAHAGTDVNITLPASTTQLDGSTSSDEDGTIGNYQWTKIAGPSSFTIVSPNSAITSIENLVEGTYYFELRVTDNENAVGIDTVVVTVGSRVLFDVGNTVTSSPDAGGKYWNNMTDGLPGVKVTNAITTANTATAITLEVINRIDGTFNPAGPGVNSGNTVGDVNDYPASATTDFAFAHPSATDGQWKIGGLDNSKVYTIKFWGTRTAGDQRIIEIKRNDESTWQSYNATNNANYNQAAVFTFTGKTEMIFDIRVESESSFGHISVIDIKSSIPTIVCAPVTPAVTIAANPSTAVCQGTSITYTATPVNGGDSPTYQWKKNGNDIPGETNSTYTTTGILNNDVISCVLTSNVFCASTPTANSNNITAVITSSSTSTTTVNACDSYLWNGTTYTASGTYTFNTTNVAGCDSIATLILNIAASPFIVGNLTGPSNACSFMGTNALTATYTIDVTNPGTITWSVPATATILTGQGTNTITMKFLASFGSGSVAVSVSSPCGTTVNRSILVTRSTPAIPTAITGPTNVCSFVGTNIEATYSIAPVPNAITYRWTLPPTATMISATPDSTSISVVFSGTFVSNTNKTLKVKSISGCSNSGDRSLILSASIPSAPSAITGPNNACLFIGSSSEATYKINKVANTNSYNWVVPTGASIVTHPEGLGVNDTVITVSYNSSFVAGTAITVNSVSGCGTSGARSFTVTKVLPSTPTAITGPTDACPFIGGSLPAVYKIPRANNATSYNWVLPVGATATHPAGSGINDTIIEVSFAPTYANGVITVASVNGCAISSARSITVRKTLPATPTITGPTDPCPFIGVGTATYTIRKISNASSYTWGIPDIGATATHPNGPGPNDTIIEVTYTTDFVAGNISVSANASCASSSTRNLAIIRKLSSTPGAIATTVISNICPVRRYSYAITALPSNATSTLWTVPNGAVIDSGQGTLRIYVTYPTTAIAGEVVTVAGVNGCGPGTTRKLTINLAACPAPKGSIQPVSIPVSNATGKESAVEEISQIDIKAMPNPTQNQFSVVFKSNDLTTKVMMRVTDGNGRMIETRQGIIAGQQIYIGQQYSRGIYFAEFVQGKKRQTIKLFKL